MLSLVLATTSLLIVQKKKHQSLLGYNSHLKFSCHSFYNMNQETYYKKIYMFSMEVSI